MQTRALMMSSAGLMLLLGLAMTFAPAELLADSDSQAHGAEILFIQAAGALYLGFAVVNWMAKDNLIGGIYSRPVALGNFIHFLTLGMALLKAAFASRHPAALLVAAVYSSFAIWFGRVTFTTPASVTANGARPLP